MNHSKLIFIRTLILASSLTLCSPSFATTLLESKKTDLDELSHQIEHLQGDISQNVKQQADLQEQLKVIEVRLGTLSQQISKLNLQCTSAEQRLDGLNRQQQAALAKSLKQRQALAKQMLSTVSLGQAQAVKIVLNQDNPATLSRYLTYYRYLNDSRMRLIHAMTRNLEQLKQNAVTITKQEDDLKVLLKEKQAQLAEQTNVQEQRQELLAKISDDTETKQQRVITLLANQRILQDVIAKLQPQETLTLNKSFDQLHGQLRWPTSGAIIAAYGSMLDVGEPIHGVIFKAEEDAPVRAIYAGKVVFANWLRGFGLLVIIDHGHGYMSLYGRNHTLTSKVGDSVSTGDEIAKAGNSGGFNESGLYFEIRQNGAPLNPNIWCR